MKIIIITLLALLPVLCYGAVTASELSEREIIFEKRLNDLENKLLDEDTRVKRSAHHAQTRLRTLLDPQDLTNAVQFNGKRYFFSNQLFTWPSASYFCSLYGMELASVETKEEDDFLIGEIKKLGWGGAVEVFMSGNSISRAPGSRWSTVNEGSYRWLTGDELTYTNWYLGNVKLGPNHHCLIYWHALWADNPCHVARRFICEENSN